MSLSFGEIFLYSKKPEKLYHFLSFLLDIEADSYQNEMISFEFSKIRFVILLDEEVNLRETRAFSLNANSYEELTSLRQNIEFYYYKEGLSSESLDLNDNQLHFLDPDGRAWCVTTNEKTIGLTHSVENKSVNVRMC